MYRLHVVNTFQNVGLSKKLEKLEKKTIETNFPAQSLQYTTIHPCTLLLHNMSAIVWTWQLAHLVLSFTSLNLLVKPLDKNVSKN